VTDWWRSANCAGTDTDAFFGDGQMAWAKRLCGRCDVAEACLQYAVTNRIDWGLWGGLTPQQRKPLRSGSGKRGKATPDRCGNGHPWVGNIAYRSNGHRYCRACQRNRKRYGEAA
jgi:WhiB family redox-sensing transcriptional regulator